MGRRPSSWIACWSGFWRGSLRLRSGKRSRKTALGPPPPLGVRRQGARKSRNLNPRPTEQPTRVESPFVPAACQHPEGTTATGGPSPSSQPSDTQVHSGCPVEPEELERGAFVMVPDLVCGPEPMPGASLAAAQERLDGREGTPRLPARGRQHLRGERKHSRKCPLRMRLQLEESNELVESRRVPTLSGDPSLPSSWTFGISGAPGALLLRISGMPRRGPPEVTRRRPGAARRAPPAVRPRGHRGERAAPPDPGTMGRRRAAWTGRGSPPTPASRQPPPLRGGAAHHPPASCTRRVTARAPYAVPRDGAVAEGRQDQGRALDIHTERGAGMAAYGLAQGSRGVGCPQQLLVRTDAPVALTWARCAISSLPSRSTR